MNTEQLMTLALEMAGLDAIPGDSAIHHSGDGIERILFGIDLKAPELSIAKDLGFDCAIHTTRSAALRRFDSTRCSSATSTR